MKIKTYNLSDMALDYAVALAEGWQDYEEDEFGFSWHVDNGSAWLSLFAFQPVKMWEISGPIIEREEIEIKKGNPLYFPTGNEKGDHFEPLWLSGTMNGPTPLVAAMREFVLRKLGPEVEVPDSLVR